LRTNPRVLVEKDFLVPHLGGKKEGGDQLSRREVPWWGWWENLIQPLENTDTNCSGGGEATSVPMVVVMEASVVEFVRSIPPG